MELNRICGANHHLSSGNRIPKRKLLMQANEVEEIVKQAKGTDVGDRTIEAILDSSARSKILLHFMKGRITLTPMETIMPIPKELEYLEGLVKLARRKKDEEAGKNQVTIVNNTPTVRRIFVNKNYRGKTMHLPVEINNGMIKGLVDTGASMSVMVANIVRKLGIMHLVSRHETYKLTASGTITTASGRLDDIPMCVGNVVCSMVFLVVDTNTYDLLLGLDFLMKIGAMVDVEKGIIQVKHEPRANVEMLPLNFVNIIQHGKTHHTSSMEPIKSLDKMFQQLQVEDLLEKGLSWRGECSSGSSHPNDEGLSYDNVTKFESEIDEEDAQLSLIMQENDVAFEDDL
jgi:predicted aspartyl protease